MCPLWLKFYANRSSIYSRSEIRLYGRGFYRGELSPAGNGDVGAGSGRKGARVCRPGGRNARTDRAGTGKTWGADGPLSLAAMALLYAPRPDQTGAPDKALGIPHLSIHNPRFEPL